MRVGESGLQTAAQVEPFLTEASGFPSPKDSVGTKVEPLLIRKKASGFPTELLTLARIYECR